MVGWGEGGGFGHDRNMGAGARGVKEFFPNCILDNAEFGNTVLRRDRPVYYGGSMCVAPAPAPAPDVSRERPPEIVVSPAMIDAGLEEFRSHHYGGDTRYMLESVFREMAYASVSASVISSSK